jgi:hypothetical protein
MSYLTETCTTSDTSLPTWYRTTKLTCRGRLQVRRLSENQYGGPVRCSVWFAGALTNQRRRPALVPNRRARSSHDLGSATGDNVWASRARSQRPSGCLRYIVIR